MDRQRAQIDSEIGNGDNSAESQVASMKALKLPPYEDKDDLDANLSRSGRACRDLMSMQPEHWSTHHWPHYCKARP